MKKNVNSVHSVPCGMPASACTWLSDPELLITSLRVAFLFLQHFVAFIAYTSCSEKKNRGKTNPKGGQAAYGETAADGHGSTQFAQSSKWWRTADPFFLQESAPFFHFQFFSDQCVLTANKVLHYWYCLQNPVCFQCWSNVVLHSLSRNTWQTAERFMVAILPPQYS